MRCAIWRCDRVVLVSMFVVVYVHVVLVPMFVAVRVHVVLVFMRVNVLVIAAMSCLWMFMLLL